MAIRKCALDQICLCYSLLETNEGNCYRGKLISQFIKSALLIYPVAPRHATVVKDLEFSSRGHLLAVLIRLILRDKSTSTTSVLVTGSRV